jgi:hypothetical protein
MFPSALAFAAFEFVTSLFLEVATTSLLATSLASLLARSLTP